MISVLTVIQLKFCTQMLKTSLNMNSSACYSKSVAKYRLPIKNRSKKYVTRLIVIRTKKIN